MSKHPLNKMYRYACSGSEWTWDERKKVFVGGTSGREFCLGDRRVVPDRGQYYVGFIVDEYLLDATFRIYDESEALTFLKSAQHQEYGCRLWSKMEAL